MRVLVAYASRHGATAGIAVRIASRLVDSGLKAEAIAVEDAKDVDSYDAYIVGSATYMYRWMKEARSFVKHHRAVLEERPVWLFSSGPLGTDLVDEEGNDVLEKSRPKEFDEFEALLEPLGSVVFFGAWDPDAPAKGMAERFLKRMPASTEGLPAGDFRDWDQIDAWADEVAADLVTAIEITHQ